MESEGGIVIVVVVCFQRLLKYKKKQRSKSVGIWIRSELIQTLKITVVSSWFLIFLVSSLCSHHLLTP